MYSIIIPVYNRPDEMFELLESLECMAYFPDFEVVIVEDGSTETCEHLLERFRENLTIKYFYKENSGPGDSRNFGMQKATGDYFLIFDSDCILSHTYLLNLDEAFSKKFYHCFGGPDAADDSFSDVQKAIDFSMTSVLTTGGLRGKSESIQKFQPRSFNMGLSREAFEKTGGFGNIHPGEDPELIFKLWRLGYETALIKKAFVYHKRRINWKKFFTQINKFGKVRPILNQRFPEYVKPTFWFPTIFILGLFGSFILLFFKIFIPILIFLGYFILIFMTSLNHSKSFKIAIYSVFATLVQFYGYGIGFLKSQFKLNILKQKPEKAFPELFFRNSHLTPERGI
jgi:glycosyltransferase involved in cell wall biosynthesis